MKRIVITSCSKLKRTDPELLPAIERYDGPNFKVLRKYLKNSAGELDIYILSSKFGLVSYDTQIPFYDQKLCRNQSREFINTTFKQAEPLFSSKNKVEVFVNLGSLYLELFQPAIHKISQTNSLVITEGSSGKRLSEMHNWLYGIDSPLRVENIQMLPEKEVVIKGIKLRTDENQIHEIVQQEISENGTKNMLNFYSWYVEVDDLKISPKWLIGQLTGLPVGKFHSDQARKILLKLGIKVKRL
jgi:hypothetical protein